ncbi:MAG: RNA-binding protein [Urechidicola sp.]|jgi:RNA-binding protein
MRLAVPVSHCGADSGILRRPKLNAPNERHPMITQKDKKRYRAIGHHLKPVVTVAGNGLNENVNIEITRALTDHELIKIKVLAADREERTELIKQILTTQKAIEVQKIGHIVLIYKAATKPNPALSNILRAAIT